jgi:hypothetical protein
MGLADGLSAIKETILTFHKIKEHYKALKDPIELSDREKTQAKLEILKGAVNSVAKGVSSIKSIADQLKMGSSELASAVPGINIVLNAVDIAINFYDLLQARLNAAEIDDIIKQMPQDSSTEEKQSLENIKKLNTDKYSSLKINIGIDFISLAGNIASIIPEPTSQVAGLSLKIIGGSSKVLKNILSRIKQHYNDKASEGQGGWLTKKIGNADDSNKAKDSRKENAIDYIFKELNQLAKIDNAENQNKHQIKLQSIIKATGNNPDVFLNKIKIEGPDEAAKYLFDNMK